MYVELVKRLLEDKLEVGRQFSVSIRDVTVFVNWCALLFMMKFERDKKDLFVYTFLRALAESFCYRANKLFFREDKFECSELWLLNKFMDTNGGLLTV